MLGSHFELEEMKKRLPIFLLTLLGTAIVFTFIRFVLGDIFQWEHARNAGFFAIFLIPSISALYLLGGLYIALYAIAMMIFTVVLQLISFPYNLLGVIAFFIIPPIRKAVNKRRHRNQMLEDNPEMTEAQATEITSTLFSLYSTVHDNVMREADSVMVAGFLMVESVGRRKKKYLLSPEGSTLKLHVFDNHVRIQKLVLGETTEPSPGDILHESVEKIIVNIKKRFGIHELHIKVNINENGDVSEFTYTAQGGLSARQAEEFFQTNSGIPVENQTAKDRTPLFPLSSITQNIMELDEEHLEKMITARRTNSCFVLFSAVCILLVILGIRWHLLFLPVIILPLIICGFYIKTQKYVYFDASRQGKPSIFISFFLNPVSSGILAFVSFGIVFENEYILPSIAYLISMPSVLVLGVTSVAVMFVLLLKFVCEHLGNLGLKFTFLFISMAYGAQVIIVTMLYLYVS